MKLAATLTAISLASASAASSSVLLEDFSSPAQKWTQQNDVSSGATMHLLLILVCVSVIHSKLLQ